MLLLCRVTNWRHCSWTFGSLLTTLLKIYRKINYFFFEYQLIFQQVLTCLSDLLKMAMYDDSNMKESLVSVVPDSGNSK